MFTACSDDNDSNPVLPDLSSVKFVLNEMGYGASLIDMANSEYLQLSWSQPEVGFPAAFEYQVEVSLDNQWTTSVAEAIADESGQTVADYATIEDIYSTCSASIVARKVSKALIQIAKWNEGAMPESQKVYARVSAVLGDSKIYSNVIEFTVIPQYVELKDAEPLLWYMVGDCIGSASWNNDKNAVGKGLIPLMPSGDEEYDKNTGTGIISYTTWFPKDGQFKLVLEPGSWDTQLNYNDVEDPDENIIRLEDGGNANIAFNETGYYTVSLNTLTNKITVVKYDGEPSVYESMFVAGSHNGWNATDNPLAAGESLNGKNHLWVGDVSFPAGTEYKFTTLNWGKDWGGAPAKLWGTAKTGQGNSLAPEGEYKVLFNDITGQYLFIAK